jgi:hypothetical protein
MELVSLGGGTLSARSQLVKVSIPPETIVDLGLVAIGSSFDFGEVKSLEHLHLDTLQVRHHPLGVAVVMSQSSSSCLCVSCVSFAGF